MGNCAPRPPTKKGNTPNANEVDITHFDIKHQIGRGGFADVFLARRVNGPKELVALKRVDKLKIIRHKEPDPKAGKNDPKPIRLSVTAWTERNVWGMIESAFLVELLHAFQDDRYLYFVMPVFAGGDLSLYLKHHGPMPEKMLRFYAAEIILALECLHSCNIVYRDLKPHNLLFRPDGHICLTDFGLCKITPSTGNGISDLRGRVGTKGFQAPEILRGSGHSYPVDFFALGITLYRLATDVKLLTKQKMSFNHPIPVPSRHTTVIPQLQNYLLKSKFSNDEGQYWHAYQTNLPILSVQDRDTLRQKFVTNQQNLAGKEVPIILSTEFVDLVSQLIDVDPHYRLGSKGRQLRPEHSVQPTSPTALPRASVVNLNLPPLNNDDSENNSNEEADFAEGEYGSNQVNSESTSYARARQGSLIANSNPQARGSLSIPPANSSKFQKKTRTPPTPRDGNVVVADGNNSDEERRDMQSQSMSKTAPRTAKGLTKKTKKHFNRMVTIKGKDEHGLWNGLHDGFKQLKNHTFFEGFDWDALANLRMPPPYVPIANVSGIEATFNDKPGSVPPVVPRPLSNDEQALFGGFELNTKIIAKEDGSESESITTVAKQKRQQKAKSTSRNTQSSSTPPSSSVTLSPPAKK